MSETKPKCKLSDCTDAFTVVRRVWLALKTAGQSKELVEFKRRAFEKDLAETIAIAKDYVEEI